MKPQAQKNPKLFAIAKHKKTLSELHVDIKDHGLLFFTPL